MERKILPYLVLLSAIAVSCSAAFYSVTGLSQMFAGASQQVLIMASCLEFAKLVLASLIYQYWSKIHAGLKFYYIIALIVLMAITSGGIYGYLSAAYSETSNKLAKIEKKVNVIEKKKELYTEKLENLNKDNENASKNLEQLTNALSNNKIQYVDKQGRVITTQSSSNRKLIQNQLDRVQERKSEITSKITAITDTLTNLDLKILELETNDEVAAEIGPLKYIADLTNKSLDTVVNWFIMALMAVFDPLAVSLVIGANVIFKNKEKYNLSDFSKEEKKELSKIKDEFKEKEKEYDKLLKTVDDMSKKEEKLLKEIENKEKTIKKYKDNKESDNIQKKEIEESDKKIKDLKYEMAEQRSEIYKEKQKLKEREQELEETKEELETLNNKIKDWENTHWKFKRSKKPPSKI